MAKKRKNQTRIEPSMTRRNGLRASAGDRVAGGHASGKRKGGSTKRKAGSGRRKSRSGSARRGLTGFLQRSLYWCFVIGLWVAIGVGALVAYYGAKMPSATTWTVPERPPNVKIVSSDGHTLANRGATGGEALTLSRMSPYIPQAVLAIEDRRFYSHFGVDPIGLARAMTQNVMAGRMVQGGSTLTQQLAKNLFLSPERTIERKVQEVLLAFWLEYNFTKDQILEMYLNRVYFGSGSYGVEAASRRYFKKPARDVNLAQAALLAGLLKAPSRLSPARNPDAAEARAQIVLEAMRDEGFVTDREITTAMTREPTRAKSYWTGAENYGADLVMDRLEALIGGKVTRDLIVDTTIDYRLQQQAEKTIRGAIDHSGTKLNVSQGALVSVDGSGAIRALVGGYDYSVSQYDRATKAKRQPGSAFKPFVYAAALEMGRTPQSVRNDAPIRIGKWTPSNYDEKYRGPVTLSEALSSSLNTIAAQLVMEAGADNVAKTARRLGIESKLQTNASIALGTSEVTLTELTAAYAPFMNGGYKATPHIIKRVRTADGKVLYENTYDNPPRVLRPEIIAMMNGMLVRAVNEGTGRKARLGSHQAAGKTGTSQAFRDALFIGYTAHLTTGVWFGNDDSTPTRKVTGGSMPALAWRSYMEAAHNGSSNARLPGQYNVPSDPSRVAVPMTRPADGVVRRPAGAIGDTPSRQWSGDVAQERTGSTSRRAPPADVGSRNTDETTTLLDIILGN
ncbi:transglycosylase domain-containing protein [Hoeflea poritis]|uniref:peptidoglycan glycosyltransferase n=1 Tax=Hoeflea poritis TaxID=2993659 RepID=A0ABT4VKQ7_9HYPH|nr:transglycosylase domain-containing protein [Hoeflea poritis]MDA4845285.1 transglycosylase domain-containing protein [Hoeflea poritis]